MPQVIEQLSCRLNIGGRWYNRGDAVQLDEADALVYRQRGMSSPAPAGVDAKNVTKVPAAQVGIVTKEPEEAILPIVKNEDKTLSIKGGSNGRRGR